MKVKEAAEERERGYEAEAQAFALRAGSYAERGQGAPAPAARGGALDAHRGDEHYTFRLTEVVAAGAVPVMIDDDFVPPFGWEDVNDWAVVLGEDDVASAPWLLNATIHEDICRLRRLGAMVGGLLEGLRGAVAAARAVLF
ncbi:unnamed protein product [Prorocentrum cordatum]|uniref:Exostosin GT47 domain-containing protein n=1 Tax=Prorocentrum cordatum TaxID=2364126 RepID=A0ABN9TQD8_9DINO|nr:unnamed protein product [Polarella glacialis]